MKKKEGNRLNDSFLHRTWVEIDLDAMEFNFRQIKAKAAGAQVMAVVKADAYGHGVEQAAQAFVRAGADWLGVSNLEEAVLNLNTFFIEVKVLFTYLSKSSGNIALVISVVPVTILFKEV